MRYLALGNLTLDEKGDWIGLGGTVAYGAWAALHFTKKVLVVSKVGRDFDLKHLNPLQELGASFLIEVVDGETARFRRTDKGLLMLSPGPKGYGDIPISPEDFEAIHLGPVSGELDESDVKMVLGSSFVSIDAQGVLRSREVGPIKLEDGEWLLKNDLDLVHFNLDEASFITGEEDPLEIMRALSKSFNGILLTLGSKGSLVYLEDSLWEVPPLVVKMEDPTGAGDVYTAALTVLMSRGEEPYDAISTAVALTSFILEHVGVPSELAPEGEIRERSDMVKPRIKQLY